MSPRSKREYLEAVHVRYKKASRKGKSLILDEFCAISGYHPKHAIRRLRGFKRFTRPHSRKRGRHALYDRPDLLLPLKRIWLAANLPCSKRLKAMIPLWLPGYARHFGDLPPKIHDLLFRISPATINRLLTPVRVQYQKRGRTSTKPGTLLKRHIPIQTQGDQGLGLRQLIMTAKEKRARPQLPFKFGLPREPECTLGQICSRLRCRSAGVHLR
jgi:hypothetical protein